MAISYDSHLETAGSEALCQRMPVSGEQQQRRLWPSCPAFGCTCPLLMDLWSDSTRIFLSSYSKVFHGCACVQFTPEYINEQTFATYNKFSPFPYLDSKSLGTNQPITLLKPCFANGYHCQCCLEMQLNDQWQNLSTTFEGSSFKVFPLLLPHTCKR